MSYELLVFSDLFYQLKRYIGPDAYRDVLVPKRDHVLYWTDQLQPYSEADARHISLNPDKSSAREEDLWATYELYAFSRVSDLLLLPFQERRYTDDQLWEPWGGPPVSAEQRNEWFLSLGLRRIEEQRFHPFYHEIVEVLPTPDPDEPITLVDEVWPGFLFGALMFCRAGVRVRGGERHIRKEIAENSTLHWTYRRNNRPTEDLSHGWGSNSQWATEFRRDYVDSDHFYYNVDGLADLLSDDGARAYQSGPGEPVGMVPMELALEFVRNRCRIVTDVTDNLILDEWTYEEDRR